METAADASAVDQMQMARALELAARGLYTTDPNPRVGCVLLRDGQSIGEGWHQRAGEPHAEILALRSVAGPARGATAYVTLEPCSHTGRTAPCADALIAAGIARVVCAVKDPNPRVAGGGIERLAAAGIAVSVGLFATQARALNPGFFSRFERGRPFIRLKLAMSLDARTAPAAGGKVWITGEASRTDVQAWRARSSAVLTGAGTVRVDDPRLDVRLTSGSWVRQPLRVVLDPELTCAPTARLFADTNALIFAAARTAAADAPEPVDVRELVAVPEPVEATGPVDATEPVDPAESVDATEPRDAPDLFDGRINIARVPRSARGLDLRAIIDRLTRLEINELFVECGPRLAAAFLEADLVDELILYVAPSFLGADAAPLAALRGLRPGLLPTFEFADQRLIQNDLRLVLTPRRA